MHPILWNAFNKYNIENFTFYVIEELNGYEQIDILEREEYYIKELNPKYNTCKEPTHGGKPNKGRKLTKEWKDNIGYKSSLYTHSDESLEKVTKNNKENATKLIFVDDIDNLTIEFNSWADAARHFNLKSSSSLIQSHSKFGK